MISKAKLSPQTQRNWLIDAGLFASALLAALSGISFLFLPVGGFQGGRNPFYGIVILYRRESWYLIHTWSAVTLIGAAVLPFAIHWKWVTKGAARRWAGCGLKRRNRRAACR